MKVLRREVVPIDKLKVASSNNRINLPGREELQTLIDSIRATGIIDDLIVNPNYEIVSGQLRWIAAKEAGLKEVPVVVCEFDSFFDEMKVSILQDYVKYALTDRDRGHFLKRAFELGYSIDDIAAKTGIHKSTLYLWASTAKLPEIIKEREGKVDESKLEKIAKLSLAKKEVIKRILTKDRQATIDEVLEVAEKVPLRELREIGKQVSRGLPVDYKERARAFEKKDELELVRLRLPKLWYERAVKIAKRENKDLTTLLLEIVIEGLKKLWTE